MIRKITSIVILIFSALSCQRQDLLRDCSCSEKAKIPITINWAKSGITPQNVTVLFYKKSDGSLVLEHSYEHNNNSVHSYVHVPVGVYTAVVFNELCNQIDNVRLQGDKNLATLGFYATENTDVTMASRTHTYMHQPGQLGLKVIRDIVVTEELIAYTHGESLTKVSVETKTKSALLLNVIPDNKINSMDIVVPVKGLNNARMPALVDLHNTSNGYMVNEDKNCMSSAAIQFPMNNRTYNEGSTTDGTISTHVAFFGTLGDRNSTIDQPEEEPIVIDILFMLVDKDKTLVNQKIDITDVISFDEEDSGSISADIEVEIDEPLPEVEPEDDGGSGFESELEDWEEVDVPLS